MPYCIIHDRHYTRDCSLCLHMKAKAKKQASKDANKLAIKLLKQKEAAKLPRKAPKKVSSKQKEALKEYSKVREQFLNGRWCAYHGKPCIPTTVHHAAGRTGDLLTDTKYFVALCMEAHRMVEEKPLWAKENGFSVSRLGKLH